MLDFTHMGVPVSPVHGLVAVLAALYTTYSNEHQKRDSPSKIIASKNYPSKTGYPILSPIPLIRVTAVHIPW